VIRTLLAAALALVPLAALAAGDHAHGHAPGFGRPGSAAEVDRTIEVEMTDIAFSVPALDVAPGETIRFVLHNSGAILHEFALATPHMHAEHEAEMAAMLASGAISLTGSHPHMNHDSPNAVLVGPGESAELIWTFAALDGPLEFACTVPGHYAAGMVGPVHGL